MYIIFSIGSLVFALVYENSTYCKKFINDLIFFDSNESFSQEYFNWFWGKSVKVAGITSFVYISSDLRRRNENFKNKSTQYNKLQKKLNLKNLKLQKNF